MTEVSTELVACPFPHEVKRGVFLEVDTEDFGFVRGACSDCGCAGPFVTLANRERPTKAERAEAVKLWNRHTPSPDTPVATGDDVELLRAADGLDHVASALQEVHALGRDGINDAAYDASMLGQIAAVERGASLLRRAAIATLSPNGVSQSAVERARKLAAEIMVAMRQARFPKEYADEAHDGFESLTLTPMLTAALAAQPASDTGPREALGEAFSTLIYIFECSDDDQASRAAKEAADKIEAALGRTTLETTSDEGGSNEQAS